MIFVFEMPVTERLAALQRHLNVPNRDDSCRNEENSSFRLNDVLSVSRERYIFCIKLGFVEKRSLGRLCGPEL